MVHDAVVGRHTADVEARKLRRPIRAAPTGGQTVAAGRHAS